MSENRRRKVGITRAMLLRVVGMILFSAFVASWFIWGPLGLICYMCGLFNSLMAFAFIPLLFGLLLLGAVAVLPVEVIGAILRWHRLSASDRLTKCCFMGILAALVTSFALGFAGMQPLPIAMFGRGFARYAAVRVDVPAIRTWLSTLDPNEYVNGGVPLPPEKQPPAITRLSPKRYPLGVQVSRDDTGRLMVRLLWGGGMIGHWGIEVGDESMKPPPASETDGYRVLGPGAWVWYGN